MVVNVFSFILYLIGHWGAGVGENYLKKERLKRKILLSGQIDESDEMLNKLYKVIMNNPEFIKKKIFQVFRYWKIQ